MIDKRKKNEGELPSVIRLKSELTASFGTRLVRDRFIALGHTYSDGEEGSSIVPKALAPNQELNWEQMHVARYRATIITKLLEDGSVDYKGFEAALLEKGLPTMPFRPEIYRQAYRDVFEYLEGIKKLPEVEPDKSKLH